MKIAFIGGGSVKWAPKLILDMALTPILEGVYLALYDIDVGALALMARVSERLLVLTGGQLDVETTLETKESFEW